MRPRRSTPTASWPYAARTSCWPRLPRRRAGASSPRGTARSRERRLRAVGLPVPAAMVCGDEVASGKPDPEGFLRARALLGVAPGTCVAFEDAPAGHRGPRAPPACA